MQKKYAKKTTKRGYKKTRKTYRRKRKTINVNRALQPIAQRTIVRMKYATTIHLSAAVPLGKYNFLINSIYDPDYTGVGHQPYGHDTFQTLYNRYRVISCHYRVNGIPTTSGKSLQMCVIPTNIQPVAADMSELIEAPRCRYTIINSGDNPHPLVGKVSIPSLVGRNKAQYMADDRYQAAFGSSPLETAWLTICAQDMNTSVTSVDTYVNVVLYFTVECFDVKQLPQS